MKRMILAILILISIASCKEERPLKQWKVHLILPTGEIYTSYTIESRDEPILVHRWGGQIELCPSYRSPFDEKYSWDGKVFAPSGWNLKIEKND